MGNYSENPGSVRASHFKPSGKWYQDVAINMAEFYNTALIHDAVSLAFEQTGRRLQPGWMLICLDPFHKDSHPVMLIGKY